MYKLLSPLFLAYLLIWNLNANGQILNGNFEYWTTCRMDNPSNFTEVSNQEFNRDGACIANVTKVIGSSSKSNAIKLETISFKNEIKIAYAVIGKPGNSGIESGVPFVSKPDSVKGIVKYNVATGDTGIFLIQFKKEGKKINEVLHQFIHSSVGFEEFAVSIPAFNLVPDTMVVVYTSSIPWDNGKPVVGSSVILDSVYFVYDNVVTNREQIPNNNFDFWEISSTETPNDWYGQQNLKRVTGINGDAVELTTSHLKYDEDKKQYYLDASFGNFRYINCNSGGPCDKVDGSHITQAKDTLVFYYKYEPAIGSLDSASVSLSFFSNHQEKKSEWKTLLTSPNFQKIEIPFDLTGLNFDTLAVEFRSSKYPHTPALLGSKLTIDHLYLKSDITLSIAEKENSTTFFYPNPTENIIHVSGINIQSILIKDVNGKLMSYNNQVKSIDCSSWTKGIYLVTLIKNNGEQINQKLIIR